MTNHRSTRVLICGAGIAGLAVAHRLHRLGVEPVLIERAPRFEARGHFIALKGNGVRAIREMGLESACRAHEVRFRDAEMWTSDGRRLRSGSRAELDESLGGYILLRRAALQQVLHDAVHEHVDIRYGTSLDDVDRDAFDVIVGADGIHSQTREAVFGEGFLRPLGGQYVALTLDYAHGLPENTVRSYFGIGQSVHLFVTSPSTVSAVIYHGDEPGAPRLAREGLRARLLDAYQEFAPDVRDVLGRIDERAFVFLDTIAQVVMPSIVNGNVALVGDAAHCPTFMSGMGASLALQGARLLARCIAEGAPLATYEAAISPIAERYQASALDMRKMILDRRPWLAHVRDFALRVTPEWAMNRKIRRFYDAENHYA